MPLPRSRNELSQEPVRYPMLRVAVETSPTDSAIRPKSPARLPASPVAPRAVLGIRWSLWLILALALGALIGVRVYVSSCDHALAQVGSFVAGDKAGNKAESTSTDLPGLRVKSSAGPVTPSRIRLQWNPRDGAAFYLLRLQAASGEIVLDGLRVDDTEWSPPDEALPALTPGEYRWQVEAEDQNGNPIARSGQEQLQIVD